MDPEIKEIELWVVYFELEIRRKSQHTKNDQFHRYKIAYKNATPQHAAIRKTKVKKKIQISHKRIRAAIEKSEKEDNRGVKSDKRKEKAKGTSRQKIFIR